MSDKFQNKYRIPSTRATWWNYGDSAAYFITICTKNRVHYFGEIVEETQCAIDKSQSPTVEMQCIASLRATEIGKMVETEWLKTPSIRPDMNLELDDYVVMPNHFHAIIWIGDNKFNSDELEVPTISLEPTNEIKNPGTHKFGPQYKNLASIIRGFKSAVTTYARKNNNVSLGYDYKGRNIKTN